MLLMFAALCYKPCQGFSTFVALTVGSHGRLQLEATDEHASEQQWTAVANSTSASQTHGKHRVYESGQVPRRTPDTLATNDNDAEKASGKTHEVANTRPEPAKNGSNEGAMSAGEAEFVQALSEIDSAAQVSMSGVMDGPIVVGTTTLKIEVPTYDPDAWKATKKAAAKGGLPVIYDPDTWNAQNFPWKALRRGASVEAAGNSQAYINTVFVLIVVFIAGAIGLGRIIDKGALPSIMPPEDRPSALTICLLAASYLLLMPGLVAYMFSYNIVIQLGSLPPLGITRDDLGNPGPYTHSMLSFIKSMFDNDNILGGVFMLFYAVIIPVLKLAALFLGEYWRQSEDGVLVKRSRFCIVSVHKLSKWASPDMFAYIFLQYLFRHMHDPPTVKAAGHVDAGFACFSVFCVLSTFASLGIRPPPARFDDARSSPTQTDEANALIQATGTGNLRKAITGLVSIFFMCMIAGVYCPCLTMRLDMEKLDMKGRASELARALIIRQNLDEKMHADVSIVGCCLSLVTWVCASGELCMVFAFVLLLGFAVILPVWHMIVLLQAAFRLDASVAASKAGQHHHQSSPDYAAIDTATLLNHIAMLDVLIMGVAGVVFCTGGYAESGLVINMGYSLIFLLTAEVIRYVGHYLVLSSAQMPNGGWPAGALLHRAS